MKVFLKQKVKIVKGRFCKLAYINHLLHQNIKFHNERSQRALKSIKTLEENFRT